MSNAVCKQSKHQIWTCVFTNSWRRCQRRNFWSCKRRWMRYWRYSKKSTTQLARSEPLWMTQCLNSTIMWKLTQSLLNDNQCYSIVGIKCAITSSTSGWKGTGECVRTRHVVLKNIAGSRHVVRSLSLWFSFRPFLPFYIRDESWITKPPSGITWSRNQLAFHYLYFLLNSTVGNEDHLQPLVLRAFLTVCFYAWISKPSCHLVCCMCFGCCLNPLFPPRPLLHLSVFTENQSTPMWATTVLIRPEVYVYVEDGCFSNSLRRPPVHALHLPPRPIVVRESPHEQCTQIARCLHSTRCIWFCHHPAPIKSGSFWSHKQESGKSRMGLSFSNLSASCYSQRSCLDSAGLFIHFVPVYLFLEL